MAEIKFRSLNFGGEHTYVPSYSWKELEDKPVVIEGGDTITWDGNTEGKLTWTDGTLSYCKVSDIVPDLEEIVGASCMVGAMGTEVDGSIIGVSGMATFEPYVFIAVEDNQHEGMYEKGIYFFYAEGQGYIEYFRIPNHNVFPKEKLNPDYLPDSLQFGDYPTDGDTITWDGDASNYDAVYNPEPDVLVYYVKVSDKVPTIADLSGKTITTVYNRKGTLTEEILSGDEVVSGKTETDLISLGFFCIIPTDGFTDSFGLTYPTKGIYGVLSTIVSDFAYGVSLTIPEYAGFPHTKKIEEKYLPDTVVQNGDKELILASSTASSTKKFKITVDDSGTLTATEVTE